MPANKDESTPLDKKIPIGTSEIKCLSTELVIDLIIFSFSIFSFLDLGSSAFIQFLLKLYQLFSIILFGSLTLIKKPGFRDFIFLNHVLGSITKPKL